MPNDISASRSPIIPDEIRSLFFTEAVRPDHYRSAREEAVVATAEDPRRGFGPTKIGGTYVRWVNDPSVFEGLYSFQSIRRNWGNAAGGALFMNPEKGVWGLYVSHGLGNVGDRYPGPGQWGSWHQSRAGQGPGGCAGPIRHGSGQ